MNKIRYLFLLLLICSINAKGQFNQSELDAAIKAGIDPYFVESRDTVSIHGPQCIVRDVLLDRSGNIWLATWMGIIKYDGRVFTNYTLKEGLIHFHVLSLFEDSKGRLWFGLARGGVYCFDGKSFQLFTIKDGLAANGASAYAEDENGNIWFATENGLSRYNGITFTTFSTKDGLADNNINALLQDKTGNLWIGTRKGVNLYDGKSFSEFKSSDGLPFQTVASLFEDKSGNIWIGSNAKQAGGKGLCRYDGKSVSDCLSPGFVMYIRQDKNGNILIAHNNYPASRYFTLYRHNGNFFLKILEQKEPESNPAIFGMMEDKNGNLWFGTAKGICRYDGKTATYFTD